MARQKLDREVRKALLEARKMIQELAKADMNEAETRTRIYRIFETIMGYDTFKHITQEYAVHGAGDTVHCDFVVQLDRESSKPDFLVEIKRVNIDLAPKHLRQAASYGECLESQGTLGTDKLFTGQRLDGTGLYYYNARYYDPEIGRFISADSIVPDVMNPQSLSRYAYCYNNPLKYNDPTGNWPSWPDIKNAAQTAVNVVKEKAGEAAMHVAGIEQIHTIAPADLKGLPGPVQITEPVHLFEITPGGLTHRLISSFAAVDFKAITIEPAGIFALPGKIKMPLDPANDIYLKEECFHVWQARKAGWLKWSINYIREHNEGLEYYEGDQFKAYYFNVYEQMGGIYGGRMDIYDYRPTPYNDTWDSDYQPFPADLAPYLTDYYYQQELSLYF